MNTRTSGPASMPAITRGRRLSKGQASASITMLPKSAHSFDDSPPTRSTHTGAAAASNPSQYSMQRQDSGYESLVSTRPQDRKLSTDSFGSSHRAVASKPLSRSSTGTTTSSRPRPTPRVTGLTAHKQTPATTLFQFPEPDIVVAPELEEDPKQMVPPATTHYWTSDHTRRLEYAAIDAARRGIRGWAKRNLVPACLAPKDGGHLDFDDDSGSVRRYRLELDESEVASKEGKRGFFSWARRR